MKLFKSLLIAPATLGLLAPLPAFSSDVDFQAISKYSNSEYELDSNSFKQTSIDNTLLSGGEGLVGSGSSDSFSSTTSASFTAEGILGGISTDDATVSEAMSFDYQYQIGLTSSFTGEDALDVTIDAGNNDGGLAGGLVDSAASQIFAMDTTADALVVDGISYTFPVGGATMIVGDNTDVSALYTGACAYSGFVDYATDCGTGNSIGLGNAGATVAASYAFDGGLSLAGGITSPNNEITGQQNDAFGMEAAYTGDDYGISVAFSDIETSTFLGVNAYYTFDFATFSAGYETADADDPATEDSNAFFVGMTKEVGPGTFEASYSATDMLTALPALAGETGYLYEASYAYPVNDYLTLTPGMGIISVDAGETTVAAVKATFSF